MALDVGELLVSIKADLTQLKEGFKEADTQVNTFSAGTVAKGTLIADAIKKMGTAVVSFAWDSLKSYGESQTAIVKLETALRNEGLEVNRNSKELQELATQLQRTTQYSDETSLEMMALLTTFGLTGEKMKDALRAAMDLSQGLGIDLRTSVMMMGKAALGETGTLARYGIVIGDNVPKLQAFDKVLDQVNSRFGGSTSANIGTVGTRIATLMNQFDDLKELIGKAVLPVFEFYANKLMDISGIMDGTRGTVRNLGLTALEMAKMVLQAISSFGPLQTVLSAFGVSTQQSFAAIDAAINKQIGNLNQWGREEEKVLDRSDKNRKTHNRLRERLDAEAEAERKKKLAKELAETDQQTSALIAKYTTRDQMMIALQTTFTARQSSLLNSYLSISEQQELLSQVKKLEQLGRHHDAVLLTEKAVQDATIKMEEDANKERDRQNQIRTQNLQSTLSFISTLSSSENKKLAAIGKASATATATMDTFAAANKALTIPPPWVGMALAGTVYAAGMANVARIVGVKLAKGGIVLPNEGGVSATLAEAGQSEAVIPLGDQRAKKDLQAALGGSDGPNITIQISGNFIEGSPSKMQRLVRNVMVPELRRYTDYNPKGLFTRRRGRTT